MKLKVVCAALFCLLTQLSFAEPVVVECPSVEALSAVPFSETIEYQRGVHLAIEWLNQYETENTWTFAMGLFKTKYPSKALVKANTLLPNIQFAMGPVEEEGPNGPISVCVYKVNGKKGIMAYAVTPSLQPDFFLKKFAH